MNTITAKELRDNLGDIVKRVSRGEQLQVTYRNKLSIKLEPVAEKKPARDPLAGLNAFLAAKKKPSPYDSNKSVKQIYHEILDEKYHTK